MKNKDLTKTLAAIAFFGLANENAKGFVNESPQSWQNLMEYSIIQKLTLSPEAIASEYSRLLRLNDKERKAIAENLRKDFSGYMDETFTLTNNHKECLKTNWSKEKYVEFVNFVADRLQNGESIMWELDLSGADQPAAKKERRPDTEIEFGYTQRDGFYGRVIIRF